jgi:hypothetical protein
MILWSVENEKCFFTLSFTKKYLRNKFTTHLDSIVHMYAQKIYTLQKFPSIVVIKAWTQKKVWKIIEQQFFFCNKHQDFSTFFILCFFARFLSLTYRFELKTFNINSPLLFHSYCFLLALYAMYITIVPCSMYLLIYC